MAVAVDSDTAGEGGALAPTPMEPPKTSQQFSTINDGRKEENEEEEEEKERREQ